MHRAGGGQGGVVIEQGKEGDRGRLGSGGGWGRWQWCSKLYTSSWAWNTKQGSLDLFQWFCWCSSEQPHCTGWGFTQRTRLPQGDHQPAPFQCWIQHEPSRSPVLALVRLGLPNFYFYLSRCQESWHPVFRQCWFEKAVSTSDSGLRGSLSMILEEYLYSYSDFHFVASQPSSFKTYLNSL